MNLLRILAAGAVVGMLLAPAHGQDANSSPTDPAIECGAFFKIMAAKAERTEDAQAFEVMGNILLNELDNRLVYLGASLEERQRIGGDAATRVSQRIDSGAPGIVFAACHGAMERAMAAVMPDPLSGEARDLLVCGSQFLVTLQSGESDAKVKADLESAATDQLRRAGVSMTKAGVAAEEQEQISALYGLSMGMVLGMGEGPIVAWEKCGEI